MRVGPVVFLTGLVLLAAGAGSAAVTAAPTAITGPVTAVGTTTATATGTVNPNGQSTSWYVEYGTTTSYGKKTASKSAGSGTGNVQVSASLTGLRAASSYHYRLVATNAAGTKRGADGIFTTASAPAASTAAATGVTPSSATLNGTVDPNGRETTWYFDYGTSTGYGARTSAQSAGSGTTVRSVFAGVGGLTAGRVYHFRLVARSDAGTSRGSDRTFSTAAPPIARTGAALEVGASSARPTGTVNPQGRSTTWYFEYGTSTRYGARTASNSAGSGLADQSVSASISRLRTGVTYHYRLVARSDAGTTRGADLTFRTAGVTLGARASTVVYGRGVLLSGRVPSTQPCQQVTVFGQRFGVGSPRAIAIVLTEAGGGWRFLARPAIQTSFSASWNGLTSSSTVVGVRPAVRFRRVGRARFWTRVVAARSFAGRRVKLQRRTVDGRWVTVKRVRLNRHSAAVFRVRLRKGTSRLRVVISINQAGPGYLAGISRTIVYRRS
jgi:hypothetical protein